MANKAVEKEKNNRKGVYNSTIYKRLKQETFSQYKKRVDLKDEIKKWKNGENVPKYKFSTILYSEEVKDKKAEKDKKWYQKTFLSEDE